MGDGANDWDTMPEISEAWGTTVAQEIELDIGRAFSGSETLLCTEGGRASLRRCGGGWAFCACVGDGGSRGLMIVLWSD